MTMKTKTGTLLCHPFALLRGELLAPKIFHHASFSHVCVSAIYLEFIRTGRLKGIGNGHHQVASHLL
jgi:hypothetical protein